MTHCQRDYVNFMLAGFSDAETAAWLGRNRVTVTRAIISVFVEYGAFNRLHLAVKLTQLDVREQIRRERLDMAAA